MTVEDKQYLASKLREDFDTSDSRFRGDFQRYEYRMELIERAIRNGLKELAEEMRSDLKVTTN
jgi:hypothetical protein